MVCGWHSSEIKNLDFFPLLMLMHMAMASAAAVPSSRREALDMGMPVRSVIMVWKLRRDSRRP